MENKEKKENGWPDDIRAAIQVALAKIKADPEASTVLRELKAQGFDEVRLAKIVYFYCGGTERQAQKGLRDMLRFVDDLAGMADRLIEDADRLKRILDKLEHGGTGIVSRKISIKIPGLENVGLPALMDEYGEMLSILAKSYMQGLSNIRIGGRPKKGKHNRGVKSAVNITAGRTQWLLYLAYLISGGSGRYPTIDHYRQIARLVAAVRGEGEPIYLDKMAATLQHSARKFQEEDLVRAMSLADAAKEEFNSCRRTRPSS